MKDFSIPSGNNLSWIDAWLQNSKFERTWERSGVPDIHSQYADGNDWDYVEENHKNAFMSAWYKTMSFLLDREIDVHNTDFEDF